MLLLGTCINVGDGEAIHTPIIPPQFTDKGHMLDGKLTDKICLIVYDAGLMVVFLVKLLERNLGEVRSENLHFGHICGHSQHGQHPESWGHHQYRLALCSNDLEPHRR